MQVAVRVVGALCPSPGAHTREQGVTHRVNRCATPALGVLAVVLAIRAVEVGGLHLMAIGEFVGLGVGNGPARDHRAVLAPGVHGVALAVVFAHEIKNQARKKCPKDVQHELGHIDVLGDCACFHGLLLKNRCVFSRAVRPGQRWVVVMRGVRFGCAPRAPGPPAPQTACKFRRGTQSCTPWRACSGCGRANR